MSYLEELSKKPLFGERVIDSTSSFISNPREFLTNLKNPTKKFINRFPLEFGVRLGYGIATFGTMAELALLSGIIGVDRQTATDIVSIAGLGIYATGLVFTDRLIRKQYIENSST